MGKYGVTSKLVWDGGDKVLIRRHTFLTSDDPGTVVSASCAE